MRYFKASLIIALISTAIVSLLFATGFTTMADVWLRKGTGLSQATAPLVPYGWQYLVIFLVAWAIAWTTVDVVRPLHKTIVALLAFVLLFTGGYVFGLYGTYFAPFHYCAAVVFSFLFGLFYGRSKSGIRKKVLQTLFGQRLSVKRFNSLVDSKIPFTFPGEVQDASVFVCTLYNHEDLGAALSVEDYVAMTNLYLRTASDYLVEVGGYLESCDGESLRVIFGAPLPDENHAVAACKAALSLVLRLDNLNQECDAKWHRRLDFRIGIHSGHVVAAAYGGARYGGFSVAGETVEFARRLCLAAAHYGARILIASDTYNLASSTFEARPIELIRRASNDRRTEIYEILASKNGLSPERAKSRDNFWKGIIYFREQNWDKAIEEFSKARIQGLPDPALDYYVQRVERWRTGRTDKNRESSALLNPVA